MPDPITEEMRLDQIERAREHRDREETTEERAEAHSAARRADKAEYLRDKLAERGRSEDEAARED
jgi:hypothetical protein